MSSFLIQLLKICFPSTFKIHSKIYYQNNRKQETDKIKNLVENLDYRLWSVISNVHANEIRIQYVFIEHIAVVIYIHLVSGSIRVWFIHNITDCMWTRMFEYVQLM